MASDLITAEVIIGLIEGALAYPQYLDDPRLSSWIPDLIAKRDLVRTNLGGVATDTRLAEAEAAVGPIDKAHDRRHRKVRNVLMAYTDDERAVIADAAALALRVLYADGLSFINRPVEVEVAYNEKFAQRLVRADVSAALAALAGSLPELADDVAAISDAASQLRAALKVVRDARLDRLGTPLSPQLFGARRDALEVWAAFAHNVEKVHKGDRPSAQVARAALIGEWLRLLSVTNGDDTPEVPEPREPTPDA